MIVDTLHTELTESSKPSGAFDRSLFMLFELAKRSYILLLKSLGLGMMYPDSSKAVSKMMRAIA